ncbi:hypothetical protein CK203_113755 [Vitis vinifera]|uniref:Reverse transcriptase domain-containing protein n=1 Tax=Vitis vinifera TaxID=29760 RepID=A0A438CPF8_VITVI|nr:hypothetical protein CK203_113755 [Vitis vinifera]
MSRGLIRSLGVGRFLDWGTVDSRGSAGGIVVFWDNRVLDLTEVYGTTMRRDMECLWNELGAIYGLWNGPWCIAGDFNAILSPEEPSRGGSLNSNMRRFSDVIEDLQLKDLPLIRVLLLGVEGMANVHRRRNNVDQIRINGVWHSEENEISERIVNAFRSLLSNPGDWRPPLFGLQCETLQNLDADALEAQFTEEEVHGALLGCSGDKALGPDGFTMAFWQFTWDFVKEDVMMGAEDLRDFRPISLVGNLYKWLAKVLANRLKKVVGNVDSKAQGAFVEGRQILDAVLIANEAIDSILKNNENGFMCKLDIEKAYDNVD